MADEDDLIAYRDYCTEYRDEPMGPATWKRRRATINRFYDWALDEVAITTGLRLGEFSTLFDIIEVRSCASGRLCLRGRAGSHREIRPAQGCRRGRRRRRGVRCGVGVVAPVTEQSFRSSAETAGRPATGGITSTRREHLMPVSAATADKQRAAMARLLAGEPLHSNGALTKENLAREARVSHATVHRAQDILVEWDMQVAQPVLRTLGEVSRDETIAELKAKLRTANKRAGELQGKLDALATVTANLYRETIELEKKAARTPQQNRLGLLRGGNSVET
ncbi:hypothetical protein ABZ695_26525 [Streptomyces sp. NPDC006976]|uniref:hypothetical protein n=1 Tax=Streptomyces sp. NPDC006976 TaxID=3154311 RepID=UPI0034075A13